MGISDLERLDIGEGAIVERDSLMDGASRASVVVVEGGGGYDDLVSGLGRLATGSARLGAKELATRITVQALIHRSATPAKTLCNTYTSRAKQTL